MHKTEADAKVGKRSIEKSLAGIGGIQLHERLEDIELLKVQVGDLQRVAAAVDCEVTTRVDTVELGRAHGQRVCDSRLPRILKLFGKKMLKAHVAAGEVEYAERIGRFYVCKRAQDGIERAHPAGPRRLTRFGKDEAWLW